MFDKNKSKNISDVKKVINMSVVNCPNCGRMLKEYDGKYGKFLGCPNYFMDQKCKKTYGINKT